MAIKEDYLKQINLLIINALDKLGVQDDNPIVETPPKKELGDVAYPMFKYAKSLKKAPQAIAADIAEVIGDSKLIEKIDLKGPYLNIFFNKQSIAETILTDIIKQKENFGNITDNDKRILVEFSCPNTNKPLHLGHCRNNVLGDSIARIYDKLGYDVNKVNLINDRGVHICKSMLAYDKFGEKATPESLGKKSDHVVGDFYVKFAQEAKENPDLEKEAQEMLVKWEAKDPHVVELWKTMNKWAVDGIKETYDKMGISFDNYQFESETYLYGKEVIEAGLGKGVFYKEDDGSTWINNEDRGLDKKIVLRADGTSLYMTQDIGTAVKRNELFGFDRMVYVVGSEQIYHFKTLFTILDKLEYPWAKDCYHLSYGMVNLPEGKMKSREGTVIDADNLIELLEEMSYEVIAEKHPDWSEEEKRSTAAKVGLGALKYYLLNFSTGKDVMFDPKKSISFDGNTGPYLQYTTARINSLLVKADDIGEASLDNYIFDTTEWSVISDLIDFEDAVKKAGESYSPLEITNYLYNLARNFNKFYHDTPILTADTDQSKAVRIAIVKAANEVFKIGLNLLGIEQLERM